MFLNPAARLQRGKIRARILRSPDSMVCDRGSVATRVRASLAVAVSLLVSSTSGSEDRVRLEKTHPTKTPCILGWTHWPQGACFVLSVFLRQGLLL